MTPSLAGVVVHWSNEAQLLRLVAGWPAAERFELVVVDNSGGVELAERVSALRPSVKVLQRGNLGFAAGANTGVGATSAPIVLLLNADTQVDAEALGALVEAFDRNPDVAGVVPRLVSLDGNDQAEWQLKTIPTPLELLALGAFFDGRRAPAATEGTPIEQPAAAALALRRRAWDELEGLDERFFPAWFEDVDLARRAKATRQRWIYWPRAIVQHEMGGSVSPLGYQSFLWIFHSNHARYAEKHHGGVFASLCRLTTVVAAALRLALVAVRRPRRARTRHEAVRALWTLIGGALTSYRHPRRLAELTTPGTPRRENGRHSQTRGAPS